MKKNYSYFILWEHNWLTAQKMSFQILQFLLNGFQSITKHIVEHRCKSFRSVRNWISPKKKNDPVNNSYSLCKTFLGSALKFYFSYLIFLSSFFSLIGVRQSFVYEVCATSSCFYFTCFLSTTNLFHFIQTVYMNWVRKKKLIFINSSINICCY